MNKNNLRSELKLSESTIPPLEYSRHPARLGLPNVHTSGRRQNVLILDDDATANMPGRHRSTIIRGGRLQLTDNWRSTGPDGNLKQFEGGGWR